VLLTLPIPNSVTHLVDLIPVRKIFFCMSWFSSILIAGCYNVSFPFCICTRFVSLISFILYLDSNQCYIFSLPCTCIRNSVLSALLFTSFYVPHVRDIFSCLSFVYSVSRPYFLFLQTFIPLLNFLFYIVSILKCIKVI
jgi:hypothetical protein